MQIHLNFVYLPCSILAPRDVNPRSRNKEVNHRFHKKEEIEDLAVPNVTRSATMATKAINPNQTETNSEIGEICG